MQPHYSFGPPQHSHAPPPQYPPQHGPQHPPQHPPQPYPQQQSPGYGPHAGFHQPPYGPTYPAPPQVPPTQKRQHKPWQNRQNHHQPQQNPPRQQRQSQQPPSQSTDQACYNCGAPGHWAQDCPEPRRSVPAGSLKQSNNARPFKRQKPNGGVVTQNGGAPHGYPPHNGQQPSPYGPPTPMSAQSPQYNNWPQQPPTPYGPPQHQNSAPYGSQGFPTPVTPYGPQFPSPGPHQGYPPQGPFPPHDSPAQGYPPKNHLPPYQQQYPHPPQRHNSYGSQPGYSPHHSPPHPHMDQAQSYPRHSPRQQYEEQHRPRQYSPPRPSANSTPLKMRSREPDFHEMEDRPRSRSSTPEEAFPLDAYWEESPETAQASTHMGPTIWHPAQRVGKPLSADYSDTESVLLVPFSGDEQAPLSKYINVNNAEESCQSIRNTAHWVELREDPAFLELSQKYDLIPIADLLSRRGWCEDSSSADQEEHSNSSESVMDDEDPELRENTKGWNVMDNLEPALDHNGSSIQHSAVSHSPESIDMEEMEQLHDAEENTEQKLARLGVTGAPKPVVSTALVTRTGSQKRKRSNSSERSPGPSNGDSASDHRRPNGRPSSKDDYPSRRQNHEGHDKDFATPSGSKYVDNRPRNAHMGQEGPPRRSSYRLTSQPHRATYNAAEPPPPPPPEEYRYDRSQGSQEPLQNSKRNGPTPTERPRESNTEARNGREHNDPERSEERKKEPLRQVDDVTPRIKKRQPLVAEAYSRRW
ncbi:MAG: Cleavage polyadenylation factor subunit clp1 [Chaenotheca gracillima]|nr:MAG: Cleavage polyadenylation factor subunit clp1 [Chaenotheca gracillima]